MKRLKAIRPRITIAHTGFSGPVHYQWQLVIPGTRGCEATCGCHIVSAENPVQDIVKEYMRLLSRLDVSIIKKDGSIAFWA